MTSALPHRRSLVSIIGDSRLEVDDPKVDLGERLGALLIAARFRILTGGLFGVAEAVSRGARMAPDCSDGDIVGLLPSGSCIEASSYVDIAIPTGLGMARNVLVASGDAVVAIGGGAGTLSEIAYAWMYHRLIIAFRVDGWSGRVANTRLDHRQRFDHIADDRIYGVSTPEEAVQILREQLPRYTLSNRPPAEPTPDTLAPSRL